MGNGRGFSVRSACCVGDAGAHRTRGEAPQGIGVGPTAGHPSSRPPPRPRERVDRELTALVRPTVQASPTGSARRHRQGWRRDCRRGTSSRAASGARRSCLGLRARARHEQQGPGDRVAERRPRDGELCPRCRCSSIASTTPDYPAVQAMDQQHLEKTRRHAEQVKGCIERLDGNVSTVKSVLGTLVGTVQAPMTGLASDEIVKNALVATPPSTSRWHPTRR